MMYWLLVCACMLSVAWADDSIYPRNVVDNLTVSNGGDGEWYRSEFCRDGTFAWYFDLKVDDEDGGILGDRTTMNGVSIKCADPYDTIFGGEAESHQAPWGAWQTRLFCNETEDELRFLVRFRLQADVISPLDQTGANNIAFECRGLDERMGKHELEGNGYDSGNWGMWSNECPVGSAICGIQTKVLPPQTGLTADDEALTDVIFHCCEE